MKALQIKYFGKKLYKEIRRAGKYKCSVSEIVMEICQDTRIYETINRVLLSHEVVFSDYTTSQWLEKA